MAIADEASGLPWPVADRHVDGGDGRRTRPCQAADDHVADGYVDVTVRFGDDRPDLLEAYGFSDRGGLPILIVDVALCLEEALERRGGDLDVGQPLYRRDGIPSGDHDGQRVPVLQWERPPFIA